MRSEIFNNVKGSFSLLLNAENCFQLLLFAQLNFPVFINPCKRMINSKAIVVSDFNFASRVTTLVVCRSFCSHFEPQFQKK